MAIVKRNEGFFPSWPHWFSDFFNRDLFGETFSDFSPARTTVPSVNIRETTDNYEVEMAAPGMKKDDFKVTLDGNRLIISSEKKDESEENEENYRRKEFSFSSFQRSFQLPKEVVDEDKIQAKYENGMLRLVIPKREEAKLKAPKTIQIS